MADGAMAEAIPALATVVVPTGAEAVEIRGGCHCGAVRFRAKVPKKVELSDCNCSICSATGFLHLIIPHEDMVLETDAAALSSYRFGTGAANHLFCRTCGIKSFYQPRSHPDCWSVNFNCIDEGHGLDVTITPFDGRGDWEAARAAMD